jgi:post-segregation antitoxin (ccd killing protein)
MLLNNGENKMRKSNAANQLNLYVDKETREAFDYLKSQGFNVSGLVQKLVKEQANKVKQLEASNG